VDSLHTMNQDGTKLPPVGSGLQYLKRKKPSPPSSAKPREGGRKAKIKEITAQKKKPRLEEQLPLDDRGGAESDEFPSKIERRKLLMSLLSSHLPSNNFAKLIDVHTEESSEEEVIQEEMDEDYRALNEALIQLTWTNEKQKRRSVWNLDTGLYQHSKAQKYISVFSEVVHYPVHSAITDDENVEWFLYSGESLLYPSALAFNISLAICIGTFD